jgi:hypothetical protein
MASFKTVREFMKRIQSRVVGFLEKYDLHVLIENEKKEYIIGLAKLMAFCIILWGLISIIIK